MLRYNFSIYTWLLLGATIQAGLIAIFSARLYTLSFAFVLLLARLGKASWEASSNERNPYLKDVLKGRYTALLPDGDSGEITAPSSRKIAVLLLGAKSNHPFGVFAPQFTETGKWLNKMTSLFDKGEVKGFMGQSQFTRLDERGAIEFSAISYWDSIEDLWDFAHSGLHREAWQWWEKTLKQNDYVGINHEIFEADAGHWETVYGNFQPTLMGATTFLKRGDKMQGGTVADEWISPLVPAHRGKLAKSSFRFGRQQDTKHDLNRPTSDDYGF